MARASSLQARRRVTASPRGFLVDGRAWPGFHRWLDRAESKRAGGRGTTPAGATPPSLDGQRRRVGSLSEGFRLGREFERRVTDPNTPEGAAFRTALRNVLGRAPSRVLFQVPVCLPLAHVASAVDAVAVMPDGGLVAVELKRGFHGVWTQARGGFSGAASLRGVPASPRNRACVQACLGALALRETYLGVREARALVVRRTDSRWEAVAVRAPLLALVARALREVR